MDKIQQKFEAQEVVQKILTALGVDDININSLGLFEDWVYNAIIKSRQQAIDDVVEMLGDAALITEAADIMRDMYGVYRAPPMHIDFAKVLLKKSLTAIKQKVKEV